MASYLKSLNLQPGSNVALLSKNCAHWIMADLAIWMAGHVSVPLYPTLNAKTVKYILEHCNAQLIFVGKLDDWPQMSTGVPYGLKGISFTLSPNDVRNHYECWDDIVSKQSPLESKVVRRPSELATIIYTSGSTGHPKGVMLSFANLAFATEGASKAMDITHHDRVLSYLPLSHALERYIVELCSLRFGFELYFADNLDTFLEDLKRAKPTIFVSVPRLWVKFYLGITAKISENTLKRLVRIPVISHFIKQKILKGLGLERVRYALSGSAPLNEHIISGYRYLGLELLEGYGMSENFAYSHLSLPNKSKAGYVGEALPGVKCRIASDNEIQVKSAATMMGYYQEPQKTEEAFTKDGYLKTGDLGQIDHQGRLKITGRIKDIFKTSKGKYVAPAPVESKLMAHPDIEIVCVAGEEQPQPLCLICLTERVQSHIHDDNYRKSLEQSIEKLIDEVNQGLDPHEHLGFGVIVNRLWSTANGFLTPTLKIKRNTVEKEYRDNFNEWYGRKKKVIFQ